MRARYKVFIATAVCAILAVALKPAGSSQTIASPIKNDKILALVSEERSKSGLPNLKISAKLSEAADLKAVDMLKTNYFAHTSPIGRDIAYWLSKTGYKYGEAGENLSIDFYSEEGAVKAWMNSQGHRANILNKNFTETGVASAAGRLFGRDTVVIVQFFAAPGE